MALRASAECVGFGDGLWVPNRPWKGTDPTGSRNGHPATLGGLREICHTILHALLRDPNTAQSGGRCGNPALHSRTACPIESAEPSGSVRKHRRATVIFHSLEGLGPQPRAGLTRTASSSPRPCPIFSRLSNFYILPRLARTARCSQGPPEAASHNLGSQQWLAVAVPQQVQHVEVVFTAPASLRTIARRWLCRYRADMCFRQVVRG